MNMLKRAVSFNVISFPRWAEPQAPAQAVCHSSLAAPQLTCSTTSET